MKSSEIKEMLRMYEEPVQDGQSRFELWDQGKNIGSSITPSTFNKDYLEMICSDILSIIYQAACASLSERAVGAVGEYSQL